MLSFKSLIIAQLTLWSYSNISIFFCYSLVRQNWSGEVGETWATDEFGTGSCHFSVLLKLECPELIFHRMLSSLDFPRFYLWLQLTMETSLWHGKSGYVLKLKQTNVSKKMDFIICVTCLFILAISSASYKKNLCENNLTSIFWIITVILKNLNFK